MIKVHVCLNALSKQFSNGADNARLYFFSSRCMSHAPRCVLRFSQLNDSQKIFICCEYFHRMASFGINGMTYQCGYGTRQSLDGRTGRVADQNSKGRATALSGTYT